MPSLPYQSSFPIHSLNELEQLATQMARFLKPGDTVALDGPLGAGKTTLSQKLTQALGIQEQVSSPTFVLMNEYTSGPFPVAHVDLYRLGEDRADSMAEELFAIADEGQSLLLVEWACYGSFLEAIVTVSIQIKPTTDNENPEHRQVLIQANRPLFETNPTKAID